MAEFRDCVECDMPHYFHNKEDKVCQYCLNRLLDADEWERHKAMLARKGMSFSNNV